jgi:hypothetical protein
LERAKNYVKGSFSLLACLSCAVVFCTKKDACNTPAKNVVGSRLGTETGNKPRKTTTLQEITASTRHSQKMNGHKKTMFTGNHRQRLVRRYAPQRAKQSLRMEEKRQSKSGEMLISFFGTQLTTFLRVVLA